MELLIQEEVDMYITIKGGNGIQRGQIYSLFSFRQTTCQFIGIMVANTNKNIRFLFGWKQKRVIKRP